MTRLPALLFAASLAAVALAGCSGGSDPSTTVVVSSKPPIAEGKGAIAGLLIDDVYRPIAGALVLLQGAGLTATTDGLGQFTFLDLEPGAYLAIVQASGHEAAPKNIDVEKGRYKEVEIEARRLANQGSQIITEAYSVFSPCSVSAVAGTSSVDCTGDLSGDTFRPGFTTNYTAYRNVTYLVVEMKANHKASSEGGAFKVVVRDGETSDDPYWASKFTADGDYLKLVIPYGGKSLDDTENRNVNWTNDRIIEIAFFPQGSFKQETQGGLDTACDTTEGTVPDPPVVGSTARGCFESRGLGPQVGVQAKFAVSLFLGKPPVDIESYSILA